MLDVRKNRIKKYIIYTNTFQNPYLCMWRASMLCISSHSNYSATATQDRAQLDLSWFQQEFGTEITQQILMIWHLCVTHSFS